MVDTGDLRSEETGSDPGDMRREVGVSLLRRISGKVILVISGPGRMMYQSLEPKPEGAIFPKRSSLRGSTALLTTLPPV